MEKKQTFTKGNVIVQNIKVGDIHYEYDMGVGIKVQVTHAPELNDGVWTWQSKFVNIENSDPIIYCVSEDCPSYLAPNLYDYEAYRVNKLI